MLVNRQTAIQSIQHAGKIGKLSCIDILRRLPSAQSEQWWIPCSDRLPKKEFEDTKINGSEYHLYPCLVTRLNESRTHTYVCKSYFDGKDFMLYGGYDIDEGPDTKNTLAWMPLPEPYSG